MRCTILILMLLAAAACGKRYVTSVTGWRDTAAAHLVQANGDAVTARTIRSNPRSLRCARLNNYFCIKNVGWNGNIGEDRGGHTAFRDPVYSARAAARDLRRKYERGNLSALQISSAYAPWTDTIGSRSLREGEVRCTIPEDPADISHCSAQPHCNCPPAYAQIMVAGTGKSITDDLKLIDPETERLAPVLAKILYNMSGHEVGFAHASPALIRRGIALER